VDVRFSLTEVYFKSTKPQVTPDVPKPKSLSLEKEVTLQSTNRLLIDGQKVRFENNRPRWLIPERCLLRRSSVGYYNGSIAKDFYPKGKSVEGQAEGQIYSGAKLWGVNDPVLSPLSLTFRPFTRHLSEKWLEEMKPSGTSLLIEGASCVEYVTKYAGGTHFYWLDPSKEYVLRRLRKEYKNWPSAQYDISYGQHSIIGWAPTSWMCNVYGSDGRLLVSTKVEVLEMRVNEPVSPDQFEFDYPPGTIVTDNRDKSRCFRVQADGSMREVSSINYEELPDSSSITQPGDPLKWLFLSLLLATAMLVLINAWRRNKIGRAL
jgi:hypothetical protein